LGKIAANNEFLFAIEVLGSVFFIGIRVLRLVIRVNQNLHYFLWRAPKINKILIKIKQLTNFNTLLIKVEIEPVCISEL